MAYTLANENKEVIQYEFTDQRQNVWIVPAEILSTKFKDAFIVHKSIGLDNDSWTVTHASSGVSFVIAQSKAEAIDIAVELINNMSYEDLRTSIMTMEDSLEWESGLYSQPFLH